MKVVSGEKLLLLPAVQPLVDPLATAARTGAMTAGVVPDLGHMPLGTAPHVAP